MGGRVRAPLAVLMAFFLGTGFTGETASRLEPAPGGEGSSWLPTLLVENTSDEDIVVRLNGLTLGTADAGRSCMLVPIEVGDVVFEFIPTGHEAEIAAPVHLEDSLHWRVRVGAGGTLEHDLGSLRPAEHSCKPSGVGRWT